MHSCNNPSCPECMPGYNPPSREEQLYATNVALNKELAEAEALLRRVKEDGGASQTLLLEIEAFLNRGW